MRLIAAAGEQATVLDAYRLEDLSVILDVSYVAMTAASGLIERAHALTATARPGTAANAFETRTVADGSVVDSFSVKAAQGPACGLSGAPQGCTVVVAVAGAISALTCDNPAPQLKAACRVSSLASALLGPVICALGNLCPLYIMTTTTMECVFNGCKAGAESYSPASFARSVTMHFFYVSPEGTVHAIFVPGQSLGNIAGTPAIRWVGNAYSFNNEVCRAIGVQMWYSVNWNDGTNYLFMDPKTYPKTFSQC